MISDRTYNNIDIDVYGKPWSRVVRRMWAHILMVQPNPYGIFDSQLGAVLDFWEDIYDSNQVSEAMEKLIQIGCFKTFRNGDVWWVRKKFKREMKSQMSGKHRLGLHKHLEKYPEVATEFESLYKEYFECFERVSKGRNVTFERLSDTLPKPIESPSEGHRNTDTDSDTDNKKSKSAKPAKVKAKDIPVKPLAELVEEIPADAFDAWLQFQQMCCASNASGEMAESRLAKLLSPILKAVVKENLTGEALTNGFTAAAGAEAPNPNYVLKAARGYRPSKGYTNTAQPTHSVEVHPLARPGGKA